ncbi:MAG: hypothetical protein E3J29_00190 [Dehalococcoidia bacterium]|nr:MAG: hypothetical protein E3J29_00190 [Dehalococcoidia bacterium]
MGDNGQHPTPASTSTQRYPTPRYVLYRWQVRRVYGAIRAPHQRHRYFVLRYKRGHAPRDATQAHFGPRGQRHVVAVLVRSDHCRPLKISTASTGKA